MSKHVRADAQPCKWIICIHSGERYGSRSAFKIADVELWLISKIRRPSSIRNIFLSYVAVPHIFPTIRSRNTDFPTNINLLTPSSFPLPPPTISRGCRFFLLPISNFFLLNYYCITINYGWDTEHPCYRWGQRRYLLHSLQGSCAFLISTIVRCFLSTFLIAYSVPIVISMEEKRMIHSLGWVSSIIVCEPIDGGGSADETIFFVPQSPS